MNTNKQSERELGEQLAQFSESVRLSASEREDMKRNVMRFVAAHGEHPAPAAEKTVRVWHGLFSTAHLRYAIGGFLAVLVVGAGSVPIAAADALPGDVLYGVKVNVNEEVEGLLAFTTEAKARFAIERIDRRFEEMVKLEVTDSVDETVAATVAEYVEVYAAESLEHAERIAEESVETALAVTGALEAVFATREPPLVELAAADDEHGRELSPLILEIDDQQEIVAAFQTNLVEGRSTTTTSADAPDGGASATTTPNFEEDPETPHGSAESGVDGSVDDDDVSDS